MNRSHWVVLFTVGLLLVSSSVAQETRGAILGRVVDPQGSVVVGAAVTVMNQATGNTLRFQTNATGYYEASLLLPGSYEVRAEATGFKKTVQRNITLPMSTRLQVDLKLELGAVSETLDVTGEAPLLETNSASAGLVLDNRSILDLPIQRGNAAILMGFTPGIQTNAYRGPEHHAANVITDRMFLPGAVGSNEFLIDGVVNIGGNRRIAYMPHTDTLQELKVETSNFDATIGHSTGASLNMMTKAGTNQFHGSLTEQHWQQAWNAAGFFVRQAYYRNIAAADAKGDTATADKLRHTPMQPPAHSNNYSAALGGPVRIPKVYDGRNKLFFFFSFNGTNERSLETGDGNNHTIPTLLNREGDFSDLLRVDPVRYQVYDPLTTQADPARPGHFIRTPFSGNVIPRSRIANPAYDTYRKFLPNPNNSPASATAEPKINYLATAIPWIFNYYALTNRLDYNHSDRHRFFVRWSWSDFYEDRADWTYESKRGLQTNDLIRANRSATADWVYTVNNSTVLDTAFSVNEFRDGSKRPLARTFKPTDVGLPAYLDAKAAGQYILPRMEFSGYDSLGNSYPSQTRYRTNSARSDLSHVRGSHTFRAGFDMRQQFRTGAGDNYASGRLTFANDYTRRNDDTFTPAGDLGLSWAAFLLGVPTTASVDTADSFATYNPSCGWYFQDNWRVTRKLSVNLGLRLEYEGGPTERYNRAIAQFDPAAQLPISSAAAAAYAKTPIPELAASSFVVRGGSVYPSSGAREIWRGEAVWMPRAALAYQFDGKTVLRAGYGMFYDTFSVMQVGPNQLGFSRSTSTTITNDFGVNWLAGNPAAGISPMGDPFPVRSDGTRFDLPVRNALGLMAVAGSSFSYRTYDSTRARQQRWRAGVQRQLGPSMVVEVAYSGAYSDRVGVSRSLNPLPAQFWADGLQRNDVIASNMNANVTNPFRLTNFADLQASNRVLYDALSRLGFFTSSSARKNQLLRPYPHLTGLTDSTAPVGAARSHEFDVKFERRFAKGFNLNVGYTALRVREADYFANEFDSGPGWRTSNEGRPQRFLATGIMELPFGRGRALLKTGLPNHILGGWQVGLTYEYQPGQLLNFSNLFYYGKLSDIATGQQTLDRWFNTDNFERNASKAPAAYHRRVFPTRVDGVRDATLNEWGGNLQRSFVVKEGLRLQLRLDALNMMNHSVFRDPDTNPVSTNFGRQIGEPQNSKRMIQIQARIQF